MKGYGNSPSRWPKTWAAFKILAPGLGVTINDDNPFRNHNTLTAWNWYLEGLRCGKGSMTIHQLRTEIEGE